MIDETAEEIADMQTHSSSVVAVKAAEALCELTEREFPTVDEYLRALEQNSSALRRANRSHASLHNTQREIVRTVSGAEFDSVDAAQERTRETVAAVVERIDAAKERAAGEAAGLLADGDTLVTHDFSTTVLAAIEQAVASGDELSLYVTESRPRYLGRRMARTLAGVDGVETTLVVDSAVGHVLAECDRALVGMTCVVDGVLYNRVGTYPLAVTAADSGVPVMAVGAAAKLIDGGFSFENEHRIASEVMREPADGFAIENPAYDATPLRLLDGVVTDEGVVDADELAGRGSSDPP